MRRIVAAVALWTAAAVAAVVVAFQGISVVGDQVTDERPEALAASDIEQRLAAAATSTTTSTAPSTASSSTTVPPTTAPPSDPAAAPPTSVTPTTAPSTTVAEGETRTYQMIGGTVVLRFSTAGAEVVFATPNPGFSVEEEPEHGNGVKVEFQSDSHESRVDGWWENGPQDRVREEPS